MIINITISEIASFFAFIFFTYSCFKCYKLYKNRKAENRKLLKMIYYFILSEELPIIDFTRWVYQRYQKERLVVKI